MSSYVVVEVLDGITRGYVYEFKCTKRRGDLEKAGSVAFVQADLYGYFFRRPRKRVPILVVQECELVTWDDLKKFKRLNELI